MDFGQDMQRAAQESYERTVQERIRTMEISRALAEYLVQLEGRVRLLEGRVRLLEGQIQELENRR